MSSPAAKLALYFGYVDRGGGHFLRGPQRSTLDPQREYPDFPWTIRHLDSGLLENGGVRDEYTGRVHWTCGGAGALWYAFYWWDRSGDHRGASNSGFYVRGFNIRQVESAFAYACAMWPAIVQRQTVKLVLDGVPATQLMDEAKDLAGKLSLLLDQNSERMTDEQRLEVLGIADEGWCRSCGGVNTKSVRCRCYAGTRVE